MPVAERFWSYVRKNPTCWPWSGSLTGRERDRPQFWFDGRPHRAARVAWMLEHGAFPSPDMLVCHSCDNPLCVRPSHLFLGTSVENAEDARAKGRVAHGAGHYRATITQRQARSILEDHADGLSNVAIAERLGVSRKLVWDVVKGRSWRHLRPNPA